MKFYHSEVMKTKLEKHSSCAFYLVIALRYFLEQLFKRKIKEPKSILRTDIQAKNKSLNQIAGSTNNLV